MITTVSDFTQSLLSVLKEITNSLYHTQSVELYDGRFEDYPESVSVSKLTFFVDIDVIGLFKPQINNNMLDVPELEVYVNLIVANRTLVNPSQKEPHLADIVLSVLYKLVQKNFFNTRLKNIGRIESLVKADSYAVMKLTNLLFILNNRAII